MKKPAGRLWSGLHQATGFPPEPERGIYPENLDSKFSTTDEHGWTRIFFDENVSTTEFVVGA